MKHVLSALKSAEQDFEFYPTTNEIIASLVRDLKYLGNEDYQRFESVLDIGAGNGKVLLALRDAETGLRALHAIEKSAILRQNLDPDILIIGTEFAEQSLLSKRVDVIFSNPPYREFEAWAEKIIRQASSYLVYLVIPNRWQNSTAIADALRFRDAEFVAVGDFDFEDAEDRCSRAKVQLLRIRFKRNSDDAFELFFKEQFADLIAKFREAAKAPDDENRDVDRGPTKGGRHRPFSKLVVGPSYPDALVNLYTLEMANVEKNYQLVGQLDVDLLREFDISPDRIMKCLSTRLAGLRNDYWNELFSHLNSITDRLASKSRRNLLNTINQYVSVDFTVSNIYAVIVWVIKNSNRYIDEQLISAYELMVAKCNVQMYKSNQKTWRDDDWRYNRENDPNTHYALDYRIVTHRIGGIRVTDFEFDKGLEESAALFLGDLLTIANNLGFRCQTVHRCLGHGRSEWISGRTEQFYFTDKKGKEVILYDVKAFKNGNLHLRLHKSFILALNVEYGRLKGWLKSGDEAVEEIGDPEAAFYFQSNLQLPSSNPGLLLTA